MKKIIDLRVHVVVGLLLMFAALLVACSENEVVKSDKVQLLSFGPSGIMLGDTITLIGENLDKVTSVELVGASIPASGFMTQSSELIRLKVPNETSEGLVTLKTKEGDVISKTILSLEVGVKIVKVPAQAKPGENIIITGNYLNWVREVTFANDTTVTAFVSQTMTELVVTVPFGAQSGPIVFATGGTEPLFIESETELAVSLPEMTSFSPLVAEHEQNLIITGANLDLTMGVLFTGLSEPVTAFVSKASSQLILKIPQKAKRGKISLIAFSGLAVESADSLNFSSDL